MHVLIRASKVILSLWRIRSVEWPGWAPTAKLGPQWVDTVVLEGCSGRSLEVPKYSPQVPGPLYPPLVPGSGVTSLYPPLGPTLPDWFFDGIHFADV